MTAKMRLDFNTPMSAGDQIVASLESNGQVLARVNQCNLNSMDEVVGLMYALAGRFMGLARLTVRNVTQGWTTQRSLATRRLN